METYFNVIPNDIISIILSKFETIEDFQLLVNYNEFRDILTDHRFWDTKVRMLLKDVNLRYVPCDLLNFKASYIIILINYNTLRTFYHQLKLKLLNWDTLINNYEPDEENQEEDLSYDYSWYELTSVLNPEVLRLDLLDPEDVDMITEFYLYYRDETNRDRDTFDIILNENSICKINLNIKTLNAFISYEMNRTDAINILTYVIFNNVEEIRY